MKKILIVGGSLQSANRGINALTHGILNGIYNMMNDDVQVKILSFIVKEKCRVQFIKDSKTYILDEIPSSAKENLKIFLTHPFNKNRSISGQNSYSNQSCSLYDTYMKADIILDLSAGDSFTDIYGIKRYVYTSLPKLVSIYLKKNYILMPQTIGPFNHKITRTVSKYIVNNCYLNFARDIVSYNYLLNSLGVDNEKVALVPDLAFNMLPSKEKLIDDIIGKNNKRQVPLIGINISALLFNGGYTSKNQFNLIINYKDLIYKIIHYFIQKSCNIILVPHVLCTSENVEDDFSLCKNIAVEIKKYYPYIYTFEKKYREDQIKCIAGKCDFFIGSRMHACIGAISMGVPTVPVAYSRKFIGIWDKYGLKDCIADAKNMTIDEIMAKIDYCYNNRQDIKDVLCRELKNVKEEINSMFELIMSC